MSWMRSRSQQPNLLGLQRETSPLPAQCSRSQASRGSATRVLGADITNRSPTPPPSQSLESAMDTKSQHHSPTFPSSIAAVNGPTSADDAVSSLPHCGLVGSDTNNEEMRAAALLLLPSCKTYLNAMEGGTRDEDTSPQWMRRRSRSSEIVAATNWEGGENHDAEWPDEENTKMMEWKEEMQLDAIAPPRHTHNAIGVDLPPPRKRARQQQQQHEMPAISDAYDALVENTLTACRATHGEAAYNSCSSSPSSNAFLTPISTNLLLTHSLTDADCGHAANQGPLLLCVPPSPPPLISGPAHLCMHARLLDASTPSWQMMTAAPSKADAQVELLSATPQGERHMRILNAVDRTIVYSPESLEDISPIPCLSDDSAVRCGGTTGSLSDNTPLHLQNEEPDGRNREDAERGEATVEALEIVDPFFLQASRDKDEEGREDEQRALPIRNVASPSVDDTLRLVVRADVLQCASDDFDEVQRSLLCWQR